MTSDDAGLADGNAADLEAAGLYDPLAPGAAELLDLLDYLVDDVGASLPELVQVAEQGGLLSFAAFRSLQADRERYTLTEAADAAGISRDLALQIWRSSGLADPRPFERRFGTHDVAMFELVRAFTSLVGRDSVLQLTRTIGESIARVAEAEVALLRSNIEAPLVESRRLVEVARTYREVAVRLFPAISDAIETLHRHHLQAIGRRYSDVGASPTALNVVQLAVGFADLAGYTGLWQEGTTSELAAMLGRFEEVTGDVIVAAGATVAKRIGDAVMFVANAPGVACALAVELIAACARAGLPKLRVGLAFGDVMVRQGDFYGPVVNLAARLVGTAEAGTALTDVRMFERLARVRGGYTFVGAGRVSLAGFFDLVETYQILRA